MNLEESGLRGISVIAFTDTAGELPYNKELATRRALVVKSYLVNAGVDSALIEANGNGEVLDVENFATDKRDGVRAAENRRAEVTANIIIVPQSLGDERQSPACQNCPAD